jgi:hypothetical protein
MKVTGILHVHTAHSHDGTLTVEEVAALARSRGFSFMLLAEHAGGLGKDDAEAVARDCRRASGPRFLAVPGFEMVTEEGYHVLGYGIAGFRQGLPSRATCEFIRMQGGIAVLAHPVRCPGPVDVSVFDGVEFWNALHDDRRPLNLRAFSVARGARRRVFAFPGLDMHNRHQFPSLGVRLDVPRLSQEDIIGQLRAGRFETPFPLRPIPSSGPGALQCLLAVLLKGRRALGKQYSLRFR